MAYYIQELTYKYQAKTLEKQLNLLLKAVGYISDKLQQARKDKDLTAVNHYKVLLRDKVDEYQEFKIAMGVK